MLSSQSCTRKSQMSKNNLVLRYVLFPRSRYCLPRLALALYTSNRPVPCPTVTVQSKVVKMFARARISMLFHLSCCEILCLACPCPRLLVVAPLQIVKTQKYLYPTTVICRISDCVILPCLRLRCYFLVSYLCFS